MNSRLKIKLFWVAGAAGGLLGIVFFLNILPTAWRAWFKPDQAEIIAYIGQAAQHQGINPAFATAIVMAESNFDPAADTGYARGLMQMSHVAWKTVEDRSWNNAYDWRDNIDAGTAYLALLKEELSQQGHFSYPLLAASYRYGINRVRRANYNLSRLPAPRNKIYQQLFAGNIPEVQAAR